MITRSSTTWLARSRGIVREARMDPIDRGLWERRIRELSVFGLPDIQESHVELNFVTGQAVPQQRGDRGARFGHADKHRAEPTPGHGRPALRRLVGLHYPAGRTCPSRRLWSRSAPVRPGHRGRVHGSTWRVRGPVIFEASAAEFFDVSWWTTSQSPGQLVEDEITIPTTRRRSSAVCGMRVAVPS